jgi:two-component system response regulator NreC
MSVLIGNDEISIVLVDDHTVVRSALRALLDAEPEFEVVAEAGDAATGLRYVLGHKPSVVVLDLNLPDMSGIDAIPLIRERSPETTIVVLTMRNEIAIAREAISAGVHGYILKEAAHEDLVRAVRLAADGQLYVQPSLGARLACEPTGPPDNLTEAEFEVLRLIALGHTNPEIAKLRFYSVRTVEYHRTNLQAKLGIRARHDLVRYGIEHDLLGIET